MKNKKNYFGKSINTVFLVGIVILLGLGIFGLIYFIGTPQSILTVPLAIEQESIWGTTVSVEAPIFGSLTSNRDPVSKPSTICGSRDGKISINNQYSISGDELQLSSSTTHNSGSGRSCNGNYVKATGTLPAGTITILCETNSYVGDTSGDWISKCNINVGGEADSLESHAYVQSSGSGNVVEKEQTYTYILTENTEFSVIVTQDITNTGSANTMAEITFTPSSQSSCMSNSDCQDGFSCNQNQCEEIIDAPVGLTWWEISLIIVGVMFIMSIVVYFYIKLRK